MLHEVLHCHGRVTTKPVYNGTERVAANFNSGFKRLELHISLSPPGIDGDEVPAYSRAMLNLDEIIRSDPFDTQEATMLFIHICRTMCDTWLNPKHVSWE